MTDRLDVTDLTDEEAKIARSMVALLDHMETLPRKKGTQISARDAGDEAVERILSGQSLAVAHLLDEPVFHACRNALKELGQRLYDIGGSRAMALVCDLIEDVNETYAGRIDAAWHGIGEWMS